MSKKAAANLELLLAAFIWGTTFVAQSIGMNDIGPYSFQAIRTFLGAAAIIPVILIRRSAAKKNGTYRKMTGKDFRRLLIGGSLTGVALGFASMSQQVGILYSTVGNAGFLTAMYLVLVPVLGIFIGRRATLKNWICVAVAAVGVYLISAADSAAISKGDLLLIACAFLFSIQILLIDHFSGSLDPVCFCFVEMMVSGLICSVPMLLLETVTAEAVRAAAFPIFYAGVMSSGVAYTLQIAGQRDAEPAIAVLFMSLESVFSLLAGIVVLHQIPTALGFLGCILIFAAVVASQLDLKLIRCRS